MAYEFFCSYARANNNDYLKRFFKDLSENVREKLGGQIGADVAFFDQTEVELGADWDATIVDALNSTRALVALASPAFFKSPYCSKELGLFESRFGAPVAAGRSSSRSSGCRSARPMSRRHSAGSSSPTAIRRPSTMSKA